jgi:two-component system, NtrC family, response regulator GlrR
MVIDDDPLVLELIQILLESEGHEVLTLDTGDNAVARVQAARPDVVFLDIVMRQHHGMEILAELRQVLPDLPVILLSGAVTQVDDMPAIARGLGAQGFLEKPFDAQKLIELVNALPLQPQAS